MLLELIHKINQKGHVYLVGGFVRDQLLNIKSKDKDMEVYGLSGEELEKILCECLLEYRVNRKYGVYHIKSLNCDLTLARVEKYNHGKLKVFFSPYASFTQASKRRDLTINSILYDPLLHQYKDPFGGIKDLYDGILRAIDLDFFKNDPLRILRLSRFVARFPTFNVELKLFHLCQQYGFSISKLSKAKIYDEYTKILQCQKPSYAFYFLDVIDAFQPFYISESTKCIIDNLSYYHASIQLRWIGLCLLLDHQTLMDCFSSNKWIRCIETTRQALSMLYEDITFNHQGYYYQILRLITPYLTLEELHILALSSTNPQNIEKINKYFKIMKAKYGTTLPLPLITGNTLQQLGFQDQKMYRIIIEESYQYQLQGLDKEKIIVVLHDKYGYK